MPTPGYIPPRNLTNPGPFAKHVKNIANDENFLIGMVVQESHGDPQFFIKFEGAAPKQVLKTVTMKNVNWPELYQVVKGATDSRYDPSETSDIRLAWQRMQNLTNFSAPTYGKNTCWGDLGRLFDLYAKEGRVIYVGLQLRYRAYNGGKYVEKQSAAWNLPIMGVVKNINVNGKVIPAGWWCTNPKLIGGKRALTTADDLAKIVESIASQHRSGGRIGYRMSEAVGEDKGNAEFAKWCEDFGKEVMAVKDSFTGLVNGDYYADDSRYLPISNEEEYDKLVGQLKELGSKATIMGSNYDDAGDASTATHLDNIGKSIDKIANDMKTSKTKYMFSGLDIMNENEQPAIDKRKFNSLMMDLSKIPASLKTAAEVMATFQYWEDNRSQGKDPFYRIEESDPFFRECKEEPKMWDKKRLDECGMTNFLDACHCLRDDLAGTRECSSFGCEETDLAAKCREMAQTLLAIADNIDREI